MASAITWSLLGSASSLSRVLVEIAEILGRHLRRHAVGFGKDDVEADDDGAELGQARDQVGDAGARPRPLAERLEAFLVDIDDDDRPLLGDARLESLKEVEGLEANFLDRRRIGDAQENQGEQQAQAQRPRQSEPSSQLDRPLHVERTKPALLRGRLPLLAEHAH